MLGQQQKTGVLNLEEDKKAVQVLFDQGKVVGVAFPQESGEDRALGRRLIRGGLVSAENWKRAFQQHKEGLLSVEKALSNTGMVTKEDLTAAVRLLTFDTVYGLFKWKGGSFRFETKPVAYDPEFVEPLSSEYLLLDVLRMVDEWPLVAERLPSFDIVLQKTNPMATLDALSGTPWEKSRTFQMEVIYDLIDGQRSIKEIIDLSFVEEFETCKNLITMMDAGLIESTATVSVKKEKGKVKHRPADQAPCRLRDAGGGRDRGPAGLFPTGRHPDAELSLEPGGEPGMGHFPVFAGKVEGIQSEPRPAKFFSWRRTATRRKTQKW